MAEPVKLGGLTIRGGVALGVPLGGGPDQGGSSRLSSANFPKRNSVVIAKAPAAGRRSTQDFHRAMVMLLSGAPQDGRRRATGRRPG